MRTIVRYLSIGIFVFQPVISSECLLNVNGALATLFIRWDHHQFVLGIRVDEEASVMVKTFRYCGLLTMSNIDHLFSNGMLKFNNQPLQEEQQHLLFCSAPNQRPSNELSLSYSRLRLYCIISNLGKTSRINAILLSFLVKIYMYFFLSRRISKTSFRHIYCFLLSK